MQIKDLEIDNRKDILLLLLLSPGISSEFNEPIIGRTRLVKMLYLFQMEYLDKFKKANNLTNKLNQFYEFKPWKFGPFSQEVYEDINFFTLRNFISAQKKETAIEESATEFFNWQTTLGDDSIQDGTSQDEYVDEEFRLTPKGRAFAEKLYNLLNTNQKKLLEDLKSYANSSQLRALLFYVYSNYPEYTDKSIIKDEVLGK